MPPPVNGNGSKLTMYLLQVAVGAFILVVGAWANKIASDVETLDAKLEAKIERIDDRSRELRPEFTALKAGMEARLISIDKRLDTISSKLDSLLRMR